MHSLSQVRNDLLAFEHYCYFYLISNNPSIVNQNFAILFSATWLFECHWSSGVILRNQLNSKWPAFLLWAALWLLKQKSSRNITYFPQMNHFPCFPPTFLDYFLQLRRCFFVALKWHIHLTLSVFLGVTCQFRYKLHMSYFEWKIIRGSMRDERPKFFGDLTLLCMVYM